MTGSYLDTDWMAQTGEIVTSETPIIWCPRPLYQHWRKQRIKHLMYSWRWRAMRRA